MKKLLILLTLLIALLAVTISAVSAQEICQTTGAVQTITFTEAQVNDAFWITNPVDRSVSNLYVDLQSDNGGQVGITATYSYPALSGVQSVGVDVTLLPVMSNGRVDWTVTAVTVNGQPASPDLLTQINDHIAASWHRWFSDNAPAGSISDVAISDDDITYTYSPWLPGSSCLTQPPSTEEMPATLPASASLPASGAAQTVTFTEAQINSAFRVTNPLNRNLSNMVVDLQSANGGQVVISATYSYRSLRGGAQSASVAVTLVPSISNGRVDWTVTSATVNGQAASADLVAQINDYIQASWHRWISENAPAGVITGVAISDSDITYTYTL